MAKEENNVNEKFVAFLKEESYEDLDSFVKSILDQQKKEKTKSAQALTLEYDNNYARFIKDAIYNPQATSVALPDDYRETLYLCFTFCRRENLREKFVNLYESIKKVNKTIFDDELLQPFRFYYIRFRYTLNNPGCNDTDYALLTTIDKVENEDNLLYLYSNTKTDIKMISKVTYADFVYKILLANKDMLEISNSRYKEFYKKSLNAIEDVIKDNNLNGYAWYYSIRAAITMLGLELGIESYARCIEIREDIQTALRLENASENGLRKKTRYLSQLSELNMFEVNTKIEESESRMREIEKNSIRKFSAFCAFVTFAVGLISKFINGGEIVFNEIVGYFFVLFGISVAIFMIFDLIVLGPLSTNFNELFHHNKSNQSAREVKKYKKSTYVLFALKTFIEAMIVVTFICLGCLIGSGTLKLG